MNEIAPTHVTESAMPMCARSPDGAPAADPGPDPALCARAPIGMLCELTHRCPLQCPYCSNPVELERVNTELTTAEWQDVMRQAAQLGVLQIHLSGGEPTARKDLEEIVKVAAEVGLYTNLITAGVTLTRERLAKLAEVGLDHVQLSIQDVDPENADRIAAYKGGMAKKIQVASWVKELGLPLTINAPIHRQNIHNVGRTIDFAVEVGAGRVEIAHVQYYAWALVNRASLMPTKEAFLTAAKQVEEAREKYKGIIVIDAIVPDYYAKFPKPCMGGWARGIVNVTPSGRVLPCHAAESIKTLKFDNIKDRPLADIWLNGEAFNAYRGTGWMKEPCRSCPRKEIDYGGCRCQAFALTGDAANTDPACSLSPLHAQWQAVAEVESHNPNAPEFIYRRVGGAAKKPETHNVS
ncbi:pyrroloquinoline quinone biosynthesis protein PqqE [Hyphomicrobium sp. CS1GBMeth3]|uniref:pyrroloquinoline quinone biosynthesis protein PqqE n=1 Tax=Hyphomicrobium sp. CS1GBMeth3 TaxID=1892845 RepID=UPI0009F9F5CC|nr:pyrroloquinoline quinone biosynthesis protein PqqE [Hyphomicrobium sp. CS1GBMeth3]